MSYSSRSLLLFVQTPAAPPTGVRYRAIMMIGMWLLLLCGAETARRWFETMVS
jgi:hypothetical protein